MPSIFSRLGARAADATLGALHRRYGGMGNPSPNPSQPPSRAAARAASPGATSAPSASASEGGPDGGWTYGPTAVSSSNVASVAYHEPSKTLRVNFRAKGGRPGATYDYIGVSAYTYADMLDAPSKGRFVHTDLTPRYAFRRVG